MAIRCPNCRNTIELASPRPGHYRPACPTCQVKFDLLIPNDPAESPRVAKLAEAATVAPAAAATPGSATATAPPARPQPAVTQSPPPPPRVDRTQFFTQVAPANLTYDDLHGRLGGYEITRKLGQGGMGSVYLARQVSLDREVALKTLSPTLADDPQFVARFTREAYAAAQLSHHNVVQIYDIGQDKGTNFFSMELIDGTDLAAIVEREGRLDPITAVTYTLQAARGLKFAHDHGLIHRDVKPENLLLNKEGLVKVADLGLVKRSGVREQAATHAAGTGDVGTTQLNTSMGTPAYMAPEQARDATKVDGRADIYSLGCTLYDLVTGRPPFSGRSAVEVMTKHQKEPITPPEKIVADLPRRLSEIIGQMTAKSPEGRYQSMGQVVRDLEDFLGVEHGGGLRGGQDQIALIGSAVERFNAAPFAKIRFNLILGFAVLVLVTLVAGLLTLTPWAVGGAIAFGVVATLSYQFILGVRQRTILFTRVRQLLFGAAASDWLTGIAVAAVGVLLLWIFGQLGLWIGVAIVAACVGVGFHFIVDHVVAVQREQPLQDAEGLIRAMRAKGIDEDGIRGFIAKFSGRRWEPFYEALFGYEAKIEARRLYGKGERGRERRRSGVWRDWIIGAIDRKLEARKVAREHRLLAKLEAKALAAKGVSEAKANRQASEAAMGVLSAAHAMRTAAVAAAAHRTAAHDARSAETIAPQPAAATRASAAHAGWLEEDVPHVNSSLEGYVKQSYLRRRYGGPTEWLLGRRTRFLLATLILIGAGLWARQNGSARMVDALRTYQTDFERTKSELQQKADGSAVQAPSKANPPRPPAAVEPTATAPVETDSTIKLRIAGVPDVICDAVGSWNGLLAGAILLLSCLPSGYAMSVLVLAGTGVTLFGHLLDVPFIHDRRWLTGAIGAAVALLSMLFVRETTE